MQIRTLVVRLRSLSDQCPWERHELPYPPVMSQIVSLVFFYNDGFSNQEPTKIDTPLNKEVKSNLAK